MDKPETLLLRVRAETLRINLRCAHERLKLLPNLSAELTVVRDLLKEIVDRASKVGDEMSGWRQILRRRGVLTPMMIWEQEGLMNTILSDLEKAVETVRGIEERSFLVKAQSIGKKVWDCLDVRAIRVAQEVTNIEEHPDSSDAWETFAKAEADATRNVFNESVELLGGIALRDARLGSEVCELADAVIHSIHRTRANFMHAIPGGIATMMMKLDPIIRLRFPEWTIWALPLTAHDVWHATVGKELKDRLKVAITAASPGPTVPPNNPGMQLCLADAFGTYTMGPAYAFAAVMLLFNPRRPEDEVRVCAILAMLTCMSPGDGLSGTYQQVAGILRDAWDGAKAGATSPAKTPAAETTVTELPGGETQAGTPSAKDTEILVPVLWKVLQDMKFPGFELSEWKQISKYSDAVLKNEVDLVDLPANVDLRHALNAAWWARVDRPYVKDNTGKKLQVVDLTERATRLAQRTKPKAPNPSHDPRVSV